MDVADRAVMVDQEQVQRPSRRGGQRQTRVACWFPGVLSIPARMIGSRPRTANGQLRISAVRCPVPPSLPATPPPNLVAQAYWSTRERVGPLVRWEFQARCCIPALIGQERNPFAAVLDFVSLCTTYISVHGPASRVATPPTRCCSSPPLLAPSPGGMTSPRNASRHAQRLPTGVRTCGNGSLIGSYSVLNQQCTDHVSNVQISVS